MIHTTIASIIQGRPLASLDHAESVHTACQLMCEHNVRAVAVVREGSLVGVLSERDVIQKCVCPGRQTDSMPATEAMVG